MLLMIGLLVACPSCKYFKSGRKTRALAALKAQADSLRVADSLQKVQDMIIGAKMDSLRRADQEKLELQAKHKYNIILGSFVTHEYAKTLSEDFRKQGYNPEILKKEGSTFELVAVEAYDKIGKALTRLKQFQDTVQFDAWLYIRKQGNPGK